MDHQIITLSNGLRVVSARSDGNVAYIGVLTAAGSRDDFAGCDGLSHFVEHTIFKGTPSRRSWQVSARMESVGGELNAYTTKDEIMLYTNAPAGYEDRAFELIADLVMNASFPEAEIDLERGVILEEILSYRDNPSFAVFDEFDEFFFSGSPLAHNILGYEETVNNITSERARQFLCSAFAPRNMVLYCVSPTDPQRLLRRVEKFFGTIDRTPSLAPRVTPSLLDPFDRTKHLDNHQANTVIGFPIFGRRDPRCYSLYLLNNILGGPAMNSRLNREMRDDMYPFSRFYGEDVNTLIFPNLTSARSSYKMLQAMNTDVEIIGPIQMGLNKPIHFIDFGSSVREVVNITAVAVIDAYVDKVKGRITSQMK